MILPLLMEMTVPSILHHPSPPVEALACASPPLIAGGAEPLRFYSGEPAWVGSVVANPPLLPFPVRPRPATSRCYGPWRVARRSRTLPPLADGQQTWHPAECSPTPPIDLGPPGEPPCSPPCLDEIP
jgi:hypothetical protein